MPPNPEDVPYSVRLPQDPAEVVLAVLLKKAVLLDPMDIRL